MYSYVSINKVCFHEISVEYVGFDVDRLYIA